MPVRQTDSVLGQIEVSVGSVDAEGTSEGMCALWASSMVVGLCPPML